ncbi:alpha/beta fold hydrolase [Amycolatopsis anabasis]|uniref:alpha/beta fold hydrolase n=1 Tax=Amycolatopsis anabasis TaxID=1840409 RepID=UPI00131A954F|nr:alpha/beta fold hydrolase [Amycolatopsis anabasis]
MPALPKTLCVLAAAVVAATGVAPGAADGTDPRRVLRTEFHVTSDPGVRIGVREVRAATGPARPVLLLHGARVPGAASFDLPVPGGSLAEDLARAGHRVYVMDARGYGNSTRPPALSQPPEAGPPAVRSDAVVRDVAAVVDQILQRNGAAGGKVALLGWATGGHWLGQYAAAHPDRVGHLVLYNTLYGPIDGHPSLGRGSDYEDPARPGQFNTARFGAYRLNTGASLLPSWDNSIPTPDKARWRDPAVLDAYTRGALASDPTSRTRTPPSFRAPTGALEDSFYLATGRQLWDASLITAATLVLRSERDFWSRRQDPELLRRHLVHARTVRTAELAGATHYAHLDRTEHGRGQLLREVTTFLGTAVP